jgi:hypothetical protein
MTSFSHRDASPLMELREQPGCVNAVPARVSAKGFDLLTMRAFHHESDPFAFAWIDQRIFRTPERLTRHGLFFGVAFRPEIMSWLIEKLGRPSEHGDGKSRRNPNWPSTSWRCESRQWDDDTRTDEWFVDVVFPTEALGAAFLARWSDRLAGRYDG